MQLIGQTVKHSTFGKGIVSDFSGTIVTVSFPEGMKRFIYPDAFSKFLTLKDQEKQIEVLSNYQQSVQTRKKIRLEEQEEQERITQLSALRICAKGQAVFNVPEEDTGETIRKAELFTGCYMNGASKGLPKVPANLKPNSACIITCIPRDGSEKDRRIAGLFMVSEEFFGSECRNGRIKGHPLYRFVFPKDQRPLYWEYAEHKTKITPWGAVRFKYISNDDGLKIARDTARIFYGTSQEKLSEEFYYYFCKLNHFSNTNF